MYLYVYIYIYIYIYMYICIYVYMYIYITLVAEVRTAVSWATTARPGGWSSTKISLGGRTDASPPQLVRRNAERSEAWRDPWALQSCCRTPARCIEICSMGLRSWQLALVDDDLKKMVVSKHFFLGGLMIWNDSEPIPTWQCKSCIKQ